MSRLFEEIAEAIAEKGYFVGRRVLPESLMRKLQDFSLQIPEENFRPGSIGRALTLNNDVSVRRDSIVWIDDSEPAGAAWLAYCEQLRQVINEQLMLGLFSFESHYAHYRSGDYYAIHRDAFKGVSNRKLSLVTYLNDHWEDSDGGQLVLYKEEEGSFKSANERVNEPINETLNEAVEIARILPEFATLVVFLSENFPHQVLPVKRDRWSAVGWYRVREIY